MRIPIFSYFLCAKDESIWQRATEARFKLSWYIHVDAWRRLYLGDDNFLKDSIIRGIDGDELVQLAVRLASIYSPPGHEKDVGDFVFSWLKDQGFEVERLGLVPERFSVVGRLRGRRGGRSLLFNSHMDQAISKEDRWVYIDPEKPLYHQAWVEGDSVCGYGVVNDKGPMAAFMIAAKAMKQSGVQLKGDLILTMVPGEIGQEPVDEFQGPYYQSRDLGTRYMVAHGVVADYAIVAECSNFCPAWVEAGIAFFKITVFGEHSVYTPFLRRPTPVEKSPNAIVRMAKVIQEIENWGYEYEKRKTREYAGGIVIPKVNIGAIRGGAPYKPARTSELCSIYLDVRLLPEEGPLEVQKELHELVSGLGIDAGIELTLFRRGYEAKNIDSLVNGLEKAHTTVFGEKPRRADPSYSSMWRDLNVFNEAGIPALTYGPKATSIVEEKYCVKIRDLVAASKVYALTAFEICEVS